MNATASRTATILCADVGLAEHSRYVTDIALAQSGRLIQGSPGMIVATFDSASAAVLAGVEIQQLLASMVPASSICIGLATGDVVWDGDVCTGVPVRLASELLARATPGQILVTNVVRWLAADASDNGFKSFGSVEIDSITGPTEIFAVDWKASDAVVDLRPADHPGVPLPAGIATAVRQPLVGRDAEWSVLPRCMGSRPGRLTRGGTDRR